MSHVSGALTALLVAVVIVALTIGVKQIGFAIERRKVRAQEEYEKLGLRIESMKTFDQAWQLTWEVDHDPRLYWRLSHLAGRPEDCVKLYVHIRALKFETKRPLVKTLQTKWQELAEALVRDGSDRRALLSFLKNAEIRDQPLWSDDLRRNAIRALLKLNKTFEDSIQTLAACPTNLSDVRKLAREQALSKSRGVEDHNTVARIYEGRFYPDKRS